MTHELAREVFGHLCHQDASRAWHFAGEPLALCARCTGVYAGAALATMALPFGRFEPSRKILWLFGAAMIQMVVLGFNPFVEPAWLRMLSGSLFSVGAVYFLWLPPRTSLRSRRGGHPHAFLAGATIAVVSLQIAVHVDTQAAGRTVETLALAGVLFLASLAVADIVLITRHMLARRSA